MFCATQATILQEVGQHPIWYGEIPYDCAYLEGTVYEKVEFDEPIAGYNHGLRVNVSVNNTTYYNIGVCVTPLIYNLSEVGGVYQGRTCKMGDIHEMIREGVIWRIID